MMILRRRRANARLGAQHVNDEARLADVPPIAMIEISVRWLG
jgi:hypothetical protein